MGPWLLKKHKTTKQKVPASFRRMSCVTLLWSRACLTRFWLAKCPTAIDLYVKQQSGAIFGNVTSKADNERADRAGHRQ